MGTAKKTQNLTDIPRGKKSRKENRAENKSLHQEVLQSESKAVAEGELQYPPAATNPVNPKMGRPTVYTEELADEICGQLAMGKSLRTVCGQDHLPSIATVYNWFRKHPDFLERYARAKEDATDAMAEDIQDIADEPQTYQEVIQHPDGSQTVRTIDNTKRTQLRIETRKWIMGKYKPKKYGDKLDVTSNGDALPTPILSQLLPTNAPDDIKDEEN